MLNSVRQHIIAKLWRDYYNTNRHAQCIEKTLLTKKIRQPILDHFAVIDLPGPHSGMRELIRLFSAIGYSYQGHEYLAEKQNDFTWMAEHDSSGRPAADVLPQVVVADFRLEEMPAAVSDIIIKYSRQAPPSPAVEIEKLAERATQQDEQAAQQLINVFTQYLAGREWPLPTVREFETVREFNELIAWVLVFGRRPNHFTLSIHLLPEFENLMCFHEFIEHEAGLPLNQDGGVIKGGIATGIEQGSTAGTPEIIQLADGTVELPLGFVEFVWRFQNKAAPKLWEDYFTGFVGNHANRVIQSLYTHD